MLAQGNNSNSENQQPPDSVGLIEVDTLPSLPIRRPDAHKGNFGRILVIGGCRGMIGAAALAGNAALRGGAGLATIATPVDVQLTVAGLAPCCTSIALPGDAQGLISCQAVDHLASLGAFAGKFDVMALGPGMGVPSTGDDMPAAKLIAATCSAGIPLVIDADALNQIATGQWWAGRLGAGCVITPHPGELARLMQTTVPEIQAHRRSWAAKAAQRMCSSQISGQSTGDAVCVLKGHQTVVTDARRVYLNTTGNPGMASGGSGDVLTGLLAALIGQGLEIFDAAALAVYLHGLAGDLAAEAKTQQGATAWDVLEYLPAAFKQHLGDK